jgi:hypothetical protein
VVGRELMIHALMWTVSIEVALVLTLVEVVGDLGGDDGRSPP